jgi:hypothetical protein
MPGLPAGNPPVPNPAASPPPGLTVPIDTILGWVKWGSVIAGSAGLSVCALMMMVGRRNRSSLAADGAAGIPWVLLGLMLASASSAIVGVFL